MSDIERRIAGPLKSKLPRPDREPDQDDWATVETSPDEEFKLHIRIHEESERERAIDQIESLGGTVGSAYGSTIKARLPADQIWTLAETRGIRIISEEFEPQLYNTTISEGVEISNADTLQSNGLDGTGVKIAIIDLHPGIGGGFDPDNPKYEHKVVDTIQSGDPAQESYFVNEDRLHGTGCTEIVHDMAPEADLVLAAFNGEDADGDIPSMLAKIEDAHPDTDVVSLSIGNAPVDRLDGQDDVSNEIERFTDEGRLCAAAAANSGDGDTWYGPFRDTNGNDYMEFDDGGTEELVIEEPLGGTYIFANWDAWETEDATGNFDNVDYTLELYDAEDDTLIDEAEPLTEPWNLVQFPSTIPEAYLKIKKGPDADGNQEFDIWVWRGDSLMRISTATSARSISIPGTTQDPHTLTTAAVQATDTGVEDFGGDLKRYSSQGPTRDGRQGIDIAAPSRVSQTDNGYGSLDVGRGFNGTSAAAPHVAGAAGQLFELDGVTNDSIHDALTSTGREISDNDVEGTNNTKIGGGYMDTAAALETLTETTLDAPSETVISPLDGSADLPIDAEYVHTVTVEKLWIDWDVAGDGGNWDTNTGVLEYSWGETQGSVNLSPTITPNGQYGSGDTKYVGGEYLLTITAEGPEDVAQTTTTIQLTE